MEAQSYECSSSEARWRQTSLLHFIDYTWHHLVWYKAPCTQYTSTHDVFGNTKTTRVLCNSWRRPSRPKRSVIDFLRHVNCSRIHPFQLVVCWGWLADREAAIYGLVLPFVNCCTHHWGQCHGVDIISLIHSGSTEDPLRPYIMCLDHVLTKYQHFCHTLMVHVQCIETWRLFPFAG